MLEGHGCVSTLNRTTSMLCQSQGMGRKIPLQPSNAGLSLAHLSRNYHPNTFKPHQNRTSFGFLSCFPALLPELRKDAYKTFIMI